MIFKQLCVWLYKFQLEKIGVGGNLRIELHCNTAQDLRPRLSDGTLYNLYPERTGSLAAKAVIIAAFTGYCRISKI